ncbi:LPS export ABC transporter periplasmic protein LptC [candidate division WOR-3 bacterium]|nr:LPS export ABC transporter periplasmic protein LptC [candidate division WOR-3 bacterium]
MSRPAALAAGLLLLAGCPSDEPVAGMLTLPDQVVEGFTMHESSSGERLYTLRADTAYVFDAEGRVDVVEPRVDFYDETGAVHAVLVARRGEIFSSSSNLVARGEVVVETADSTLLQTDSLGWNNTTREVRTDAPVDIATPKGRVSGQGLVSDAGLTRIRILSEVSGQAEYRFEAGPDSGE